jgi:MFS family permease
MPTAHSSGRNGLWTPDRRALTIGLILTVTIVASESLAVATIMPIVADDLAAGSRALYGWVFSGFLLGSLVGIVLAGLLVDRSSLARAYLMGIVLFAVGLLVGGLAPTMEVLVGSRVLQGIGAGAIPAVAYVAIGRALPERLRPLMFATLSTAWVVPGIVGPALAGIVAEAFHWRLVFLGLLPLAAVAVAMTLPAIAAVRSTAVELAAEHEAAARAGTRLPFALVLAAGAGLTVAGLTDARLFPGVALVVAGLALGIPAFRRLTPPGTLRAARGMPATVLLRGMLTFAFFTADVYVALALVDWRGLSAATAGLALTAATLTWTAGSWAQARWVGHYGTRAFVRAGTAVVAVGVLGFMTVLIPDVPVPVGVAFWAVAGLGMGLSYSPLSLTVLRDAPPESQGAATAGLQLSDVLGTSLGTGIGGALIAFGHREGYADWVGLAAAFALGAIMAVLGFLVAGRMSVGKSRSVVPAASSAADAEGPAASTPVEPAPGAASLPLSSPGERESAG